ncbi:hypothetical protein Halru_2199 [Halovivax ruber XH-70]|uniref:Uncharacterized protein n=2 Tax=Halovivax TaxID=332951 RepID=L0IF13_HALRX|nr:MULTISPECIES: hypothetical protein [Halovivax]AGB16786.1 hypothetical protein Halru_2199 [Halovivax ruber XH-70]ELZ08356.1 hypothetical protein C479_13493 [Halovivax asiaticus JCM 14624]
MPETTQDVRRLTADALVPGTTVCYHHRQGRDLATITETDGTFVTFVGENCDARFTHRQIERLLDAGRLEIVLTDDDS